MTGPAITIRPAVETDASAIAAIAQSAYQGYIERIGKAPAPMQGDYEQAVAAGDTHIAVVEAMIVGFVVIVDNDAGFLLDNVAVAPDCQGQGVGRALIGFAEHEARVREHDHIVLYTNERMTENRALYARLGYTEVARIRQAGHLRIYMKKPLGAQGVHGVNLRP